MALSQHNLTHNREVVVTGLGPLATSAEPTKTGIYFCLCITTACQLSCGKVMFSVVSVRQSFCPGASQCDHYHDALDLTASPPPGHQTWDLPPLALTSGGHYWTPV